MRGIPGRQCGTMSGYSGGCRCDRCRFANRQHYHDSKYRGPNRTKTPPRPGGVCVFCDTPIAEHPIRACWREAL